MNPIKNLFYGMSPRKVIAFIICMLFLVLLGYTLGYAVGYTAALNWAFEKAIYILDFKGIEIDINKDMIISGLITYKNHAYWDKILNITQNGN